MCATIPAPDHYVTAEHLVLKSVLHALASLSFCAHRTVHLAAFLDAVLKQSVRQTLSSYIILAKAHDCSIVQQSASDLTISYIRTCSSRLKSIQQKLCR